MLCTATERSNQSINNDFWRSWTEHTCISQIYTLYYTAQFCTTHLTHEITERKIYLDFGLSQLQLLIRSSGLYRRVVRWNSTEISDEVIAYILQETSKKQAASYEKSEGGQSSNTSGLYSQVGSLESVQGHQPSWLRSFFIFLTLWGQIRR
jgi:hypothetical protein